MQVWSLELRKNRSYHSPTSPIAIDTREKLQNVATEFAEMFEKEVKTDCARAD